MANQLGKFTPNLAEVTKPLRDLLSSKNSWTWGEPQAQASTAVKTILSSSPVLALYSPDRDTIVSADASAFGLGGVPLQKQPAASCIRVKSTYTYRAKICSNREGGSGYYLVL